MTESTELAALANHLRLLTESIGERVIVGIVGAPGTGKSTFTEALQQQFDPGTSVIVPMDGFHLANALISGTSLSERKGAIDTFDGWGYLSLLERLRARNEPVVYAPAYRRGLEEPISASIAIPSSIDIILTEGNYLLSDRAPWNRIRALLNEAWYVDVPRKLRIERLVERHIRYGMAPNAALAWANGPDENNAKLIESTRGLADRVIAWS